MKSTIFCKVLTYGQEVVQFALPWNDEVPSADSVRVTGEIEQEPNIKYLRTVKDHDVDSDVKSVELKDGMLYIDVVPFRNKLDFTVEIGDKKFPKASFEAIETEGLDLFEQFAEDEVLYSLYSPKTTEKRPLLLYLHGAGNGDPVELRDNRKQLLGDYGPVNWAQTYPDMYIMAPQAIEEKVRKSTMNQPFKTKAPTTFGWYREYLVKICDIIRRMIREGKVDEKRVYVIGLSMGGAGTIRAMSVGSDLFAACAPVCPTMIEETYNILRTMEAPVWVSTAYVDHTIYRHKYIVDAIMELKDKGHKNAHLTIYSPEELSEYEIGVGEGISYKELFKMNHRSWVLTFHDEKGIMSWLLNQHK